MNLYHFKERTTHIIAYGSIIKNYINNIAAVILFHTQRNSLCVHKRIKKTNRISFLWIYRVPSRCHLIFLPAVLVAGLPIYCMPPPSSRRIHAASGRAGSSARAAASKQRTWQPEMAQMPTSRRSTQLRRDFLRHPRKKTLGTPCNNFLLDRNSIDHSWAEDLRWPMVVLQNRSTTDTISRPRKHPDVKDIALYRSMDSRPQNGNTRCSRKHLSM